MTVYDSILQARNAGHKLLAILIDPDKPSSVNKFDESSLPDIFLVGGSLTANPVQETILSLKQKYNVPVVLFPGNATQLSDKADALLFLSLISGRNPDFLIGQHVLAAPFVHQSGIECIPTGYMLIESGKQTAVSYISQTSPIPAAKDDIAVATALAGELLGLRMIYLEAGSGADSPVPPHMISVIRDHLSVPLVVGGGIRNELQAEQALNAGADMIVVGNSIETDPSLAGRLIACVHSL
ncbi:MAG: geranylgeranylglyceryl/heptaprenylglyceryl phosphate synthase [Paludibacteraceae bacterium]|nr:geranylgeranylglyceryl/heptaprenylglyceryl phosphate synthase [Paludibacteraceae bacterium]